LSYLDNLYSNPFLRIDEDAKIKLKPILDLLFQEKSNETIQVILFVL